MDHINVQKSKVTYLSISTKQRSKLLFSDLDIEKAKPKILSEY